ncbi:hypothetical protein [Allohahella sp. A8]|uniref:hypothetical protein n=1 Tax=Allohahella sp. A8 TaxID=3141461 RepID=UPI003A801785
MFAREEDMEVLRKHGITSIQHLASIAADLLRNSGGNRASHPSAGLSQEDRAFFRRVGAHGVDGVDKDAVDKLNRDMATEYAILIESALTSDQVARKLGVSTSRVRQRILNSTLYSIKYGPRRLFPLWQFSEGRAVRHLEDVLPLLDKSVHPLTAQEFFTSPHSDLEGPRGELCSPIQWLEMGHDVEKLKHIVRFL